MGWCPNAALNKKITLQKEEEIFEMGSYSKPSLFISIRLKNVYAAGITKVTIIYITMALIFAILWFSPFFNSYLLILIMLSALLLQFTLSKTSVEITDKRIRLTTVLNPLFGATTRAMSSVDSVKVQKNNVPRFLYIFLFLIGILWLFLFFLYFIEGASQVDIAQSLLWTFFSFGVGLQSYEAFRSVSNIRIRFTPYPFVNKITIHTTEAGQIADLIEKVRQKNPRDKILNR